MDEQPLLLTSLLPAANIRIPLRATSKQGAVEELVDLLSSLGQIGDRERTLRLVWEREKLMSTGIGYGVAIPHALSDAVTVPSAALGIKPGGIDYAALDGKPATILFLLVSPQADNSPHIRILARLSRVFRHEEVRDELARSATAEEAAAVIRAAELQHGRGES
jgi:fructose-specific phosphotransferase system IIA component